MSNEASEDLASGDAGNGEDHHGVVNAFKALKLLNSLTSGSKSCTSTPIKTLELDELARDSGYGSATSTADPKDAENPLRKPSQTPFTRQLGLCISNKRMEAETKRRFLEVQLEIERMLLEAMQKLKSTPGRYKPIAIRPMMLGKTETDVDAKAYMVVICSENIKRKVREFFDEPLVKSLCEPDDEDVPSFKALVIGHALRLRASTSDIMVRGDAMNSFYDGTKTFCGTPIRLCDKLGRSRNATFGGMVKITSTDGEYHLYGLTAGHMISDDLLVVDEDDKLLEDFNDTDLRNLDLSVEVVKAREDQPKTAHPTLSSDIDQDGPDKWCFSDKHNLGKILGADRELASANEEQSQIKPYLDWALFELNAHRPNQLAFRSGDHFRGDLHLPLSSKEPSKPEIRVSMLCASQGVKHGVLSTTRARVLFDPGNSFTDAYMLSLEDEEVTDGDSGSWVVDELRLEVYGHVVADDVFGDAYVIPMSDILADIKHYFGAESVDLPSGLDIMSMGFQQQPQLFAGSGPRERIHSQSSEGCEDISPQEICHNHVHARHPAVPCEPALSFDDDLNSSPPDQDSMQRLKPTGNGQSGSTQTDLERRVDIHGLRAQLPAGTDSGGQGHLGELFQGRAETSPSLPSISTAAHEDAIKEESNPVRPSTLPTNSQKTNLLSKTKVHAGSLPNRQPRSYWWWGKIAAVVFSISCMAATVVLLANINNTRLSAWSFYFHPNTVVSIITTLSKLVMLFNGLTSLSQLKWTHFQTRPEGRRLNRLDDTSRASLGSLLMLWSYRLTTFATFMLSLISVASLIIDPMAQQVLKLHSKDFPLHFISAGIGQTSFYSSNLDRVFSTFGTLDPLPMDQQAQLLASIMSTGHEPQFSCPPRGSFSQLPDATHDKFVNATCKLSVVDMRTDPLAMNWYTGRTNAKAFGPEPLDYGHYDLLDASIEGPWKQYRHPSLGSDDAMSYRDQPSGPYAKLHIVRTLDYETLYNIGDVPDYTTAMWPLPMPSEFLRVGWHFCEQVYSDVSVNLGVHSVGNVTTNPLTLVASSASDYTLHSNASGLNYTVSRSINAEWDDGALSQALGVHLGYSPTPFGSSPAHSTSDSNDIFYSMPRRKNKLTFDGVLSHVPGLIQSLSIYLRSADIEDLAINVASTLTARTRSNTTGDIANLTMLSGQAFVNEAYIAVQWPWLILPIAETVLTAVTMAITIVLTRQQALLKGSTVSLLRHQIDGWSLDETRIQRLDTSERLLIKLIRWFLGWMKGKMVK